MAGEDNSGKDKQVVPPALRMYVEQDPPTEVNIGGIRMREVGSLKPEHVDPIELEQMQQMPGVETELVDENGEQRLKIRVNEMILQPGKITGEKKKGPLED